MRRRRRLAVLKREWALVIATRRRRTHAHGALCRPDGAVHPGRGAAARRAHARGARRSSRGRRGRTRIGSSPDRHRAATRPEGHTTTLRPRVSLDFLSVPMNRDATKRRPGAVLAVTLACRGCGRRPGAGPTTVQPGARQATAAPAFRDQPSAPGAPALGRRRAAPERRRQSLSRSPAWRHRG